MTTADSKIELVRCPCGMSDELMKNEAFDMCLKCGRQSLLALGEDAVQYFDSLPKNYIDNSVGEFPEIYIPSHINTPKGMLFLESKGKTNEYVVIPYRKEKNPTDMNSEDSVDDRKEVNWDKAVRFDMNEYSKAYFHLLGLR